jgi:phosphoribosylformimino-5-aminoimidazole carboxamide ribotide isomerase
MSAIELASRVRDLGVERVVYTDIARDGMLSGVNVEGCPGIGSAHRVEGDRLRGCRHAG